MGSPNIHRLIEFLNDNRYDSRERVISQLVQIGELAVEPLIEALSDEQWRIRASAAVALGRIGNRQAIAPLNALLQDEHGLVREAAVGGLIDIGGDNIVASLISVLDDPRYDVRELAAWGLGKSPEPRVIEALINLLEDEEIDVQDSVVFSLTQIGEPAIEPLAAALDQKGVKERRLIAEILGRIGGKHVVELLTPLLDDQDPILRKIATVGLTQQGKQDEAGSA